MISKSPRIAAQSGVCLKAIIPTIVTSTIPNADQMAYATPIGAVFRQLLRQQNDNMYNMIDAIVGNGLVKPSATFNSDVALVSIELQVKDKQYYSFLVSPIF